MSPLDDAGRLETLVHRWDAQTALGRPPAVDADLLSAGAVLTGPQATAETVLAAALTP